MLKNLFMPGKQSRWLMGLTVCGLWCVMLSPTHAQPPDPPLAPPTPIERVTMEQAHKLVGGPTLITLNFDNAMPQAIYEELFRQAGISPILRDTNFWVRHTKPLRVHFERKPFWEAVGEMETLTGLTIYFNPGNPEYMLDTTERAKQSAPFLQGPRFISDSFQVVAGSIAWTQHRTLYLPNRPAGDDPEEGVLNNDGSQRTVTLYVLTDPKFDAPRATHVQIEEAVDEKGKSLLAPADQVGLEPSGMFPAAINFHLVRAGGISRASGGVDASRKIARLKGTIRMTFISATDTWEMPDPLNSPTRTRELFLPEGREEYFISKLEADGNSLNMTYQVRRPQPSQPPGNRGRGPDVPPPSLRGSMLFTMLNNSLSMVDADGVSHPAHVTGGGGSAYDWKTSVSFSFDKAVKEQPQLKLVWKIPLEWKVVEVPFEFTNLPLP